MCLYNYDSILEKYIPAKTAKKATIKLAKVYRAKDVKSPLLKRTWFSYANVEKVVNPPQKPVANNRVWFCVNVLFLAANPIMIPINRLPKIFAVNVPIGILWSWLFKYLAIIYLKTLPKPPPIKTNNNCFIFL